VQPCNGQPAIWWASKPVIVNQLPDRPLSSVTVVGSEKVWLDLWPIIVDLCDVTMDPPVVATDHLDSSVAPFPSRPPTSASMIAVVPSSARRICTISNPAEDKRWRHLSSFRSMPVCCIIAIPPSAPCLGHSVSGSTFSWMAALRSPFERLLLFVRVRGGGGTSKLL
jgi:hypothetical protein